MKREIPKKNYALLILLCIVSIIIVVCLMNLYKANQPKKEKTMSFLSEIKTNEMNNYITENREVIIYASSSNNEEITTLEKEIKKYISNKSWSNSFVYLDLSEVDDKFYEEFYIKYFKESSNNKIDLKKEPSLIIMVDGKVDSYLNNIKNIDEFKQFLNKSGVLE